MPYHVVYNIYTYYKRVEYTLIGIKWSIQEIPKRGAHILYMRFYITKLRAG